MPATTRAASRRATSSAQTTVGELEQATTKMHTNTKSRTAVTRAHKTTEPSPTTTAHKERDERVRTIDPRWEAAIASHPPIRRLPAEYCVKSGNYNPPHLIFGWTCDQSYMLEIARRHRFTFKLDSGFRRRFGGCEEFNFGDLTEEHLSNPRLRSTLESLAASRVRNYIREHTRASFTSGEPLSTKGDMILVLWSNYGIDEKYRRFRLRGGQLVKLKEFMDVLMNECLPADSERFEPMWWWSTQNDFMSFSFSTPSGDMY